MDNISELLRSLPKMKAGQDLIAEMTVLPEYSSSICTEHEAVRLIALSDIYKIYLPSQMSVEIYSKLYLALLRSLQKKCSKAAVHQQRENFKAIRQHEYNGILGGSDSFTIIGTSGIGKSSAINRAIDLITAGGIIETKDPYRKVIPCVVIQCPFDASVKGLLLEVLRKVDEYLNSNYYENALRVRATTDMLIGSVSQVALNHIGLLVVDEIQHVVNNKNGKNLIGSLTQLINNSGISICMIGTPESSAFFEQAMQLARRSIGLRYNAIECNAYFRDLCRTLFSYQYVRKESVLTDSIIEWLYEHSSGVISVVVSLVHDAQEIAILNGSEVLSIETLNAAYQQRLSMLHGFIEPNIKKANYASQHRIEAVYAETDAPFEDSQLIFHLVTQAKHSQLDIVTLMREHFHVSEVAI